MKRMRTSTILCACLLCTAFAGGNPLPVSADNETINHDYTVRIDDPDGNQRLEEDEKVIRTADGGFLGVYSEGSAQNIFVGKAVKLNAQGEEEWTREIVAGYMTRANSVCEDAQGNIYVGGTYQEGMTTHPYVSAFAADGTPLFEKKMEQGAYLQQNVGVERLLPYADGIVAVSNANYVRTDHYTASDVYYNVINANGTEVLSGSLRLNNIIKDACVFGSTLAVIGSSQLVGIDLATGSPIETIEGSGNQYIMADEDAVYLINAAGNKGNLIKYGVEDGKFVASWTYKLPLKSYFTNGYIFPGRNNDLYVVVKQSSDKSPVLMSNLTKDGECVASGTPKFANENVGSGFFYWMGFDSEGNVVLAGHASDYLVYMAKFTPDFQYISAKEYLIGSPAEGFTYSYMRPREALSFGNKMVASCYIRHIDENEGYYPYIAQWDLDGDMNIDWSHIAEPGATPSVRTNSVVAASDGGTYVAVHTRTKMIIRHFDADGQKVWETPLLSEEYSGIPDIMRLATLSNGTLIGLGTIAQDPLQWGTDISIICAFSPQGQLLWNAYSQASDEYFEPYVGGLMVSPNDDIYALTYPALCAGNDYPMLLTKITKDGQRQFTKALPSGCQQVAINAASMDAQGLITAAGYVIDDNWTKRPFVARLDGEGELKYFNICFKDAAKPMVFVGAYTNAEGETFATGKTDTGTSSQDAPVYCKLTVEGDVAFEAYESDINGYFNNVGPVEGGLVFSGIKADNMGGLGWIRKVNANMETIWETTYGDYDTFMTHMSPANALDFAGYTIAEDGLTRLFVAQFDANGNLMSDYVGEPVPDAGTGLYIASMAATDGKIYVVANTQETNNVAISLLDGYSVASATSVKALAGDAAISYQGSRLAVEGATSINLYSASGALVASAASGSINVKAVPAGLYILSASTPNGAKHTKIMLGKR